MGNDLNDCLKPLNFQNMHSKYVTIVTKNGAIGFFCFFFLNNGQSVVHLNTKNEMSK